MAPPTPQQLFSDAQNLVQQAIPLLEGAYAFSQVVGHILVATNQTNGPPPTYYIGEDLNNPTAPAPQPASPPANAPVPIASFGDQAGGLALTGTGYEIFLGLGGNPIATVSGSFAGGAPVLSGNSSLNAGGSNFPVAGQGSPTAVGPITDVADDGVYMGTDVSHGTTIKHTLYNVSGTVATWDADGGGDLTSGVAREVNGDHYYWQGVSYPAETFPMGPSVKAGVAELVKLISLKKGTFAIMGYSQGAIVTCKTWRDEILNPNGQLHDRLDDFIAHVSFGNPMRCPGIANGNALAGLPMPPLRDGWVTGGIAGPDNLTPWQTMPQHMDFADAGDLFTDCPTGMDPWSNETEVGAMETGIYKVVMGELTGENNILLAVGKILTDPFGEMVPLIEALINGMQFLADGSPHYSNYVNCKDAAIKYLRNRGAQVPARNF